MSRTGNLRADDFKRIGPNQMGSKCGRGWVGLRGACQRAKAGVDRKELEKASKLGLAAKIKARRAKAKSASIGETIGKDNGKPDDRTPGSDGSSRSTQAQRVKTARSELTKKPDLEKVPEKHRKHLSPDQQIGVALAIEGMDRQGGFLLADGTGVGKTRQMLAIADNYAAQGKKVLIISKAEVLKPDWKKGKASGSFSHDGELMGITPKLIREDALESGKIHLSTYQNLSKLKDKIDGNTIVLYDEAHSLKNWDSAQTKHGNEISKKAGKVLFATATPADKPLQLGYLERAGIFAGNSRSSINEWLGYELKDQHVGGGRYVKTWERKKGVSAETVHGRMAGLFDEMTEKGLMVKREISMSGVPVSFDRVQIPDEARKVQSDIAKMFSDRDDGLAEAQKLMHQRRQLEPYKIPAAINAVQDALSKGRQAIVFVSRVNESGLKDEDSKTIASSEGTAKALKAQLEKAGITDIAELHGGGSGEKAIKAFQTGKAKVVIATVESGGTGVNLDDTTGNAPRSMIMLTPPFSAVDNVQAIGRVWRMSTKSTPEIRYLVTDTAVDEWNAQIISNKMSTLDAAINGVKPETTAVTTSERPPKPTAKAQGGPPKGAIVNKYGGYSPKGEYIKPGEGYAKNVNGRWVVYAKSDLRNDAFVNKHLGTKCGRGWKGLRGNCRRSTSKKSGKGGITAAQKSKAQAMADRLRMERGKSAVVREGTAPMPFDRKKRQSASIARNTMSVRDRREALRAKFDPNSLGTRAEILSRKEEQRAIIKMGGRKVANTERLERGVETEAIAKAAKLDKVRRSAMDRAARSAAPKSSNSTRLSRPTTTKGAEFVAKHVPKWLNHEGMKEIARAIDFDGGVIDTGNKGLSGDMYSVGKVQIVNLNAPSKSNKYGSATVKFNEGGKERTQNVDLPSLAAGVKSVVAPAPKRTRTAKPSRPPSPQPTNGMFPRKADPASRSKTGRTIDSASGD